ncbi:hypothetical protein MTsPCn9_13770 [Croceitalea sp. MTPC9]|uniref:META domain-containing protein n=1 Tax=unclassified Croceitalea TaxID=2632280 RepID=UPI002B381826|nr:hypothetical protein MTsPCn6_15360 [Croceitalea sp. MTPC6]GMN16441.1 hypothetical protein MTsPCn9_13770 [Croceitalea sp. MTPC9]
MKRIISLFLLISVVSCETSDNSLFNNIRIQGEWEVVEINEIPAPEGEVIRITFNEDGFGGSTATNSYSGSYSLKRDEILFEGVFSTLVVEFPYGVSFFGLIVSANNRTALNVYFTEEDTMVLSAPDSRYMVLKRQ